jgi:hypothetical protein
MHGQSLYWYTVMHGQSLYLYAVMHGQQNFKFMEAIIFRTNTN